MEKVKFKYKINELLDNLPRKEYTKALRAYPAILGVSLPTFNNYRSIKIDDTQDIPHEKVMILEKLFKIGAGELANFEISDEKLEEINANDTEI